MDDVLNAIGRPLLIAGLGRPVAGAVMYPVAGRRVLPRRKFVLQPLALAIRGVDLSRQERPA